MPYSASGATSEVFLFLDGPIRANRFAESLESPGSCESSQGSRTEPLFCELRFGALTLANRRFEAIRANHSNVMKIGFSCESIHANRFARIAPLRIAGASKFLFSRPLRGQPFAQSKSWQAQAAVQDYCVALEAMEVELRDNPAQDMGIPSQTKD